MFRTRQLTTPLLLMLGLAAVDAAPAGPRTTDAGDSPVVFVFPDRDEFIAWLPAKQAPTAAVAQARIHIDLHRARRLAAQQLCKGIQPPQGRLLHRDGPYLTQTPGSGERVWLYRLTRSPRSHLCQRNASVFFRTLSHYLPAWIVVRAAGQHIAWRQGGAIAANRPALMVWR